MTSQEIKVIIDKAKALDPALWELIGMLNNAYSLYRRAEANEITLTQEQKDALIAQYNTLKTNIVTLYNQLP